MTSDNMPHGRKKNAVKLCPKFRGVVVIGRDPGYNEPYKAGGQFLAQPRVRERSRPSHLIIECAP